MKTLFLRKWDRFVYYMLYHSLRRMCAEQPGIALLISLQVGEWLDVNPPSEEAENLVFQEYVKMSKMRAKAC